MIYTVTFNPSVDCILHIGDVKFGGLNRASKEEFFFSGKGINVSTVLHRLGAATSADSPEARPSACFPRTFRSTLSGSPKDARE